MGSYHSVLASGQHGQECIGMIVMMNNYISPCPLYSSTSIYSCASLTFFASSSQPFASSHLTSCRMGSDLPKCDHLSTLAGISSSPDLREPLP